jgi:hypothetical protein
MAARAWWMYNLTVAQDHTYTVTVGSGQWVAHNINDPCGGGGDSDIHWSSKTVKQAAQDRDHGATDATVSHRSEAEELFLRRFQGDGYTNTTDMSPAEAKDFSGSKQGTYHWDDDIDSSGRVQGHGSDNPHGGLPHLQIHPFGGGSIIRIFFQALLFF